MTNCLKEDKGKMNFVSPFSSMVELLRYIEKGRKNIYKKKI
jgi:hypothetical protein